MIYTSTTFKSLGAPLCVVCGVLFLLSGCGHGNGQGLDDSGNLAAASNTGTPSSGGDTGGGDTGGNTTASGNPNARLAWVQSNVFGGVCSQCHTGAGAPLGVNWSSETDTCSNIDRPSGEISTMMEIKSGFPDESYLIWKVSGAGPNGEPIVFEQMPAGGNPALSADTIQNIRDWIADGTPGCTSAKSSENETTASNGSSVMSNHEPGIVPGSWSEVWNQSLRVCTLCHSINPSSPACSTDFECPPNGVVLSEDNYSGVVDGNTVAPFDLERSNLWKRVISSDHNIRMPLGMATLTPAQLDIIQHWIEDGAPFCPQDQVCQ